MKKAVILDLFETLITEWGHEKYTKRQMSHDLHCPFDEFGTPKQLLAGRSTGA